MTEDLGLNAYQQLAGRTAAYPGRGADQLTPYPALGLCGEAGEVAEHFKKALRDDAGELTEKRRAALKKELGDVLWYAAAVAFELKIDLAEVARANLEKLADRQRRGVISGEGDER